MIGRKREAVLQESHDKTIEARFSCNVKKISGFDALGLEIRSI
jgi:hypothetical protein